ncbi:hypothetical protein HRI_004470100 [Hibiscus trionum]|uniref:Uncharacterized protein n=1 Tax=Hibiscus trionum TaxID=183268 RepID=A0A9W7JA38_HIBTR|nr:hypothetical protein HRI_004470100 [Hibiscus trionum]
MVNNSEAIRILQDASVRHDQSLEVLQSTTTENAKALQDVLRQLTSISEQLGQSSHATVAHETTSGMKASRGKEKLQADGEEGFPFPPKPAFVELPLFTGKDPEEWIASAQDFLTSMGQKTTIV